MTPNLMYPDLGIFLQFTQVLLLDMSDWCNPRRCHGPWEDFQAATFILVVSIHALHNPLFRPVS